MNRIAKSLCMVAVIALAFTACKKKEDGAKMLKFNHATEQMTIVDDEFGGRMYLDDNYIMQFNNHDTVSVFNIVDPSGDGAQYDLYDITGNGDWWTPVYDTVDYTTDGAYYAFYPGGDKNVDASDILNENRVTFTLKPIQDYRTLASGRATVPAGALYVASKAKQTSLNDAWFQFKNICGVLSLRLYSPTAQKVTKIEVTDKSFNIVGNVTLKIHEVDPTEMTYLFNHYDIHDAGFKTRLQQYLTRVGYQITGTTEYPVSKTVTLNCVTDEYPEGVQLGTSASTFKEFYIVMRPLALMNGCDVKVYFDDNTDATIYSTVSNTIQPSMIRNMRPINVDEY